MRLSPAVSLTGSVALALIISIGAAACHSESNNGAGIPPVTAAPTSAQPSVAPSGPPPSLPTSPSCSLLTEGDVRDALGGGEVQKPFGTVSTFSGAAGFPVKIDECSWQQHSGT